MRRGRFRQECRAPDGLLYGDVNGDGRVDSRDVQMLVGAIVGNVALTPDQRVRADLNGDTFMNVLDVTLLQQFIGGQIDHFPVCPQQGGGGLRLSPAWLVVGALALVALSESR